MDARQEATQILSETECWELLDQAAVGRLAVDVAGQPDIFPINFVVDNRGIVFRTAAGTKLAGAVLNRLVAFEIDGYEPAERSAWSVVVKGHARPIERMQEMFEAEDLPLFPWLAWEKPNFVRIDPTVAVTEPFPFVPPTWIVAYERCGSPRSASAPRIRSSPKWTPVGSAGSSRSTSGSPKIGSR